MSSEQFTNDYINSVRDDRQESFKRRYPHRCRKRNTRRRTRRMGA
ncbi:MAG: hypothetical protein ACFNLH_08920 [Corynebacterium matruchotii]